jgi:hypothetical protein
MGRMPASPAVAERAMLVALRPWTRRLAVESTLRWLVRGAIVAHAAACLVLAVGWLIPLPAGDLRPIAFQLALPLLALGVLIGLWPTTRLHRAGQLDTRLRLADRLATAWLHRDTSSAMALLQRRDALAHLATLSPSRALPYHVRRVELAVLGAIALIALTLLVAPSPMEGVLRQIAAEQRATQYAADRLDALRQDPMLVDSLTPEQARHLDELLQRTRLEVSQARNQRDAVAALTRAEQQLMQFGDLGAEAREQALGAMSETLSQEPLTRRLGDALQRGDARGASEALQSLRDTSDQLSDAQRQALARALQRAANVGRADSRSSAAMRDAARAVSAGESADARLRDAAASIEEAMQATAAEAAIREATQRLQDVRNDITSGTPGQQRGQEQPFEGSAGQYMFVPGGPSGTAVPIDAAALARGRTAAAGQGQAEPGAGGERGTTGGVSAADLGSGQPAAVSEPSESIFVPGRTGDGPTDSQDAVQQPFSLRGAPRPYREVIGQYAQQGRDYVDRAAVPPNVRELVRQYFADLEGE